MRPNAIPFRTGCTAGLLPVVFVASLWAQGPTATAGASSSTGATSTATSAGATGKTTVAGALLTTTSSDGSVKSVTLAPQAFSNEVHDYAIALGSHMTAVNLSKSSRTGTYKDSSGTSQISVTWQNPGNVRLVLSGQQNKTVVWNGKSKASTQALDQTTSDLLDALADDAPEPFFFSIAQGAGYRLLATRVRADGGNSANYGGPWLTIYHRIAPAPSTGAAIAKLFLFDSATGLLHSVRYLQGSTPVEVVYSNWTLSSGGYSAGTITRYSGSSVEFTLSFGAPAFAVSVSAAQFSAP